MEASPRKTIRFISKLSYHFLIYNQINIQTTKCPLVLSVVKHWKSVEKGVARKNMSYKVSLLGKKQFIRREFEVETVFSWNFIVWLQGKWKSYHARLDA